MSDLETGRIEAAIRRIALNHTRKLDRESVEQWARELRPHAGPVLTKVLGDFALGTDFPNVGEILAKYYSERKAVEQTRPAAPLTPRERQRSDIAAVFSMLWLVYEKRWRVTDFAGTAMARAFGGDPAKALRVAMEEYDREFVTRWMTSQPEKEVRDER